MEEEILKVKKLESISILAGGIAHDFNNLLQGILGNISFAKLLSEPGGKIYEILDNAENTFTLARSLTDQLIAFSKGGEPVKESIPIGKLIEDIVHFSLSGSNISGEFQISPDLWPVEADEGQLTQVIQNITINAREAMPGGGRIEVQAANARGGKKGDPALKKGRWVKISITDHGSGISSENLARIFDPYFTTKELGSEKGMGLGLTTCHTIVRKHHGLITVESEPGRGTTFQVCFPASGQEVEEKKEAAVTTPVTKGSVLFMDDEKVVTDLAVRFLGYSGFEVVVAKNGEEAVEHYQRASKSRRPFDAVVLDLTIPGGMGGEKVIQRLLAIDPEVKAIVSSGYSSDPVMTNFKEYGFRGALTKPYEVGQLTEMLSTLLK
jgi:CheY-like chemotaxis protein